MLFAFGDGSVRGRCGRRPPGTTLGLLAGRNDGQVIPDSLTHGGSTPCDLAPRRRGRRRCLVALGLAGCGGGKYPVRGTVTLDDGTPLTKGLVVFERVDGGPPITARGEIQADGTYELSTDKPGDGVPPGKYKVLLNPLDLSDVPDEAEEPARSTRSTSASTRPGWSVEVKDGANDFPIKLDRPAKKARR